jgi:proteasome accessory factor C
MKFWLIMSKELSAPLLRTARLLDLVPYLNSNQGISIKELATDFGVSTAQINSDLTTLWMCGLPGYTPLELMDLEFESGFVTIRNAPTLSKPRSISFDEGLALMLGLELLQQQIPIDREDLHTEIEVLKDKFSNQFGVPRAVTVSHAIDPSIISPVMHAINTSRDVEITYHSLYSDEISVRTVLPLAIFVEGGNNYLRAFCRRVEAIRIFRLDRIVSLSLIDAGPDGAEVPKSFIETDEIDSDKIFYTIKIKRLTRDVIERFNLSHLLQDNPKTRELTIELSSFSGEWIKRAVLATGSDVELLSPSELRNEVANRAQLLIERYT